MKQPEAVYLPSELEEEVYDPFTGPKVGLGFSDKQQGQGQEQVRRRQWCLHVHLALACVMIPCPHQLNRSSP